MISFFLEKVDTNHVIYRISLCYRKIGFFLLWRSSFFIFYFELSMALILISMELILHALYVAAAAASYRAAFALRLELAPVLFLSLLLASLYMDRT